MKRRLARGRILATADDLTGAFDTAAAFAGRGLATEVLVAGRSLPRDWPRGRRAVVVNTGSRHAAPAEAARRVTRAVRWARARGAAAFFKKTDSTLRGNIGAELAAFAAATGAALVPFVPAYPAAGRTVEGGRLLVRGVPVHRTAFARDPGDPVRASRVAAAVARTSAIPVLATRDAGGRRPPPRSGRALLVPDVRTDRDLDRAAAAFARAGLLRCAAGSAALAARVAARLAAGARPPRDAGWRRPVLIVNGSLQSVALAQVRAGRDRRVATLSLDGLRLGPRRPAAGDVARAADALLRLERDVILTSVAERGEADRGGAFDAARELGRVVRAVVRRGHAFGALACFGGETTAAILGALRVRAVHPIRELWPGVVYSRLHAGRWRFDLITKSGGFGPADLVARLVRGR